SHLQERHVAGIPTDELPRVLWHELFSAAAFTPLHPGQARGRLRVFDSTKEYRSATLQPHDIVVMPRVPDDIPRVAGMVNTKHTTPLSHTNILATGWRIPNAVQTDGIDRLGGLDGQWVRYRVDDGELLVEPVPPPARLPERPP